MNVDDLEEYKARTYDSLSAGIMARFLLRAAENAYIRKPNDQLPTRKRIIGSGMVHVVIQSMVARKEIRSLLHHVYTSKTPANHRRASTLLAYIHRLDEAKKRLLARAANG